MYTGTLIHDLMAAVDPAARAREYLAIAKSRMPG